MKHYYRVTSNGITFGSFVREMWANAYAAALVSAGFECVEVDIEPFIISTQSEFEEKIRRVNSR